MHSDWAEELFDGSSSSNSSFPDAPPPTPDKEMREAIREAQGLAPSRAGHYLSRPAGSRPRSDGPLSVSASIARRNCYSAVTQALHHDSEALRRGVAKKAGKKTSSSSKKKRTINPGVHKVKKRKYMSRSWPGSGDGMIFYEDAAEDRQARRAEMERTDRK